MFQSIFAKDNNNNYQQNNLAEVSRFHLLFRGEEDNDGDTIEDIYKGFVASEYKQLAEIKAKDERAARESVQSAFMYRISNNFSNAVNTDNSDSTILYKKLFRSFDQTLFGKEELDNNFQSELATDLVRFMTGNTVKNNNLIPYYDNIKEQADYIADREIAFDSIENSAEIRRDFRRFKEQSFNTASMIDDVTNSNSLNRAKKLLDNVDYVNRPGILPAAAMLADANKEFFIDIFQLQSSTLQDYYISNILERVKDYREGIARGELPDKFKFNVRLAMPVDKSFDLKTFDILGPNLGFFNKLQRLKDTYGEEVDINLMFADKKSHPKFLLNEQFAAIGTQNLTNPIGKSLYQAGSNYESLRVLEYKYQDLAADQLASKLEAGEMESKNVDAESLMYLQARKIMQRTFGGENKFLSTGMRNVGGPVETMEHLRNSLQYLDSGRGRTNKAKMSFILDQVFLLQYEKNLFGSVREGEMGKHDSAYLSSQERNLNNKAEVYQKMQHQFLNAIIEGRAIAVVDIRNYKEKVLDPIRSKLQTIGLLEQYDYDLSNFVNKVAGSGNTESKIQRLTSELNKYNLDSSMAVQLLAMQSGNITTAAVPRQHVKGFLLSDDTGYLAGKLGSSNMGLYSLAMEDSLFERETVNYETDLIFGAQKVRHILNQQRETATVGFGISAAQETEELNKFALNHHTMLGDLTVRRLGQMQYTDVVGGEWQNSVDKRRLFELHDRLKALESTTQIKMGVGYEYDNRGNAIALSLTIDPYSVGNPQGGGNQLKYKFTTLKAGSGEQEGFVLEINKSKLISETEFANMSTNDIATGFERNGNPVLIRRGQREKLSPIETTISLLTSVTAEASQLNLVRFPKDEFVNRYSTVNTQSYDNMLSGTVNYLNRLFGSTGDINSLLSIDEERVLYGLADFEAKFKQDGGDVFQTIRNMTSSSPGSTDRLSELLDITNKIKAYASADNVNIRKALLLGGSNLSVEDSIIGRLNTILSRDDDAFADIRFDFISAQKDYLYGNDLNRSIKNLSGEKFESFLLYGQANTYSKMQARRKRPVYGVTDSRFAYIKAINTSGDSGVQALNKYALMNSPASFGATSDLGAGELLYIAVAEGGGSRETRNYFEGIKYGLNNMLPYYKHENVGDVSSLKVIEDAHVGAILKVEEADNYYKTISFLGDDFAQQVTSDYKEQLEALSGEDGIMLQFYFDKKKKASQIPQRIKNVIGSRPLRDLSQSYQEIIDNFSGVYVNRFSNAGQKTKVKTVDQLRQLYIKDVRGGLSEGYKEKFNFTKYSLGALYADRIAPVLSAELSLELEAIRKQVAEEFGITEQDTYDGVGAELLRATLLSIDTHASAVRGFLGSSQRYGPSVMLMQLEGAYSDYYYANPEFGGKQGLRQGFVDRAVKGFQGSKLRATVSTDDLQEALGVDSWNLIKNVLSSSGEIIQFDDTDRKTWVYKWDESVGDYVKDRVVDSRKQFGVANNIIEKVRTKPSFTTMTATSNAASFYFEDAKEVLRDIRVLGANLQSNEILIEVNYDRTVVQSAGRRSESQAGGLFKGVPIFAYGNFIKEISDKWNRNSKGAFQGSNIGIEQIQGVANPSNFKSYFFEHGSQILTYTKNNRQIYKEALLGNNTKTLAASLMLTFGTEMFNQQGKHAALDELTRLSASGALGNYMSDMYKLNKLNSLRSDKTNPTDIDIANQLIDSMKADVSDLNVRTLGYISMQDIADTLAGVRGADVKFKSKLSNLLSDPTGNIIRPGYLNLDSTGRGRELAMLAGGIDMTLQLMDAQQIDIATANLNDEVTLNKLAFIAGEKINNLDDEGKREETKNILNRIANYSRMVGVFTSVAGSQSKVSMSSRSKAYLEAQHLVGEEYSNQSGALTKGNIPALRSVLSTVLGSIYGGSQSQFISATNNLEAVDLISSTARSSHFKGKFLGFYDSGVITAQDFKIYKGKYNLFSTLKELTSNSSFSYSDSEKAMLLNMLEGDTKNKTLLAVRESEYVKTIVTQINSGATLGQIQSTIDTGLISTMGELEDISTQYKLLENKLGDISHSQAIIKGMEVSGAKRMAFSFPYLEVSGNKVRFDKNRTITSFTLSPEDLRVLGDQYGEFVAETVKSQLVLWEGLAARSDLDKVLDKIYLSDDDSGEIAVSSNAAKFIETFQETALNFPVEVQSEIISSRFQTQFGARVGLDGSTFTAAASLLVPERALVGPKALYDKFGGAAAKDRLDAISKLDTYIKRVDKRLNQVNKELTISGVNVNKTAGELPSSYIGALFNVPEFSLDKERKKLTREKARITTERRLIESQYKMLHQGISPVGSYDLNKLVSESKHLVSRIKSAENDSDLMNITSEIEQRLRYYQGLKRNANNQDGDYYVRLTATSEMHLLQSMAVNRMKSKNKEFIFTDNKGEVLSKKSLKNISRQESYFRKAPTVIDGLQLGTKNSFLPHIRVSSLEGELRKGTTRLLNHMHQDKLNIDANSLQSRIDLVKDLASKHSQRLEEDFKDFYKTSKMKSDVDKFNSRISQLEKDIASSTSPIDLKTINQRFESLVSYTFTNLNLSQVQLFRSPPPGNFEINKMTQYNVFNLEDLDNSLSELGIPIKFAGKRNQTLGMINPIGAYQSQLGDFDGDSVSTIMSNIRTTQLRAEQTNMNLARAEITKSSLEQKIAQTDDEEKLSLMQSHLEKTNRKIANLTEQRDELRHSVDLAEKSSSMEEFRKASKAYVSNYIKVDEKMLDGVDTGTLFTLIEQGRGLFGGMEDVIKNIRPLHDAITSIARDKTALVDDEAFKIMLTQQDPQNTFAKSLLASSDEYRETVRQDLETAVNTDGITAYVTKLFSTTSAGEQLSKYQSRGLAGTAVNSDQWEMMLKTLGQAGSVILGKTYNSMASLLYTESPFLALSSLLENDTDGKLGDSIKTTLGEDAYEDMMHSAKEGRAKSMQMGGFLQIINQLMRDSIKPKDSVEFLNEISEDMEEYRNADSDEDKEKVIDLIVGKFGPGTGLKSLVQLDRLVNTVTQLKTDYTDEKNKQAQYRTLNQFEIDINNPNVESHFMRRLGFVDESGEVATNISTAKVSTYEPINKLNVNKMSLVAAYKTKQDLLNLATGFAFEKARGGELKYKYDEETEKYKWEEATSSGISLQSLLRKNIDRPDFAADKNKMDYLIQGMEAVSQNKDYFDTLSIEQQEYYESFKSLVGEDVVSKYMEIADDDKLLHAHQYMKMKQSIETFAGEKGEGLIEFANYNQTRSKLSSGAIGQSSTMDISQDPTSMSYLQLATAGKITPQSMAYFMNSMLATFQSAENEHTLDHDKLLLKLMEGGTLSNAPEKMQMMELYTQLITQNKDSAEMIFKRLNATQFGAMAHSVEKIFEGTNNLNPSKTYTADSMVKNLAALGLSQEEAKNFVQRNAQPTTAAGVANPEVDSFDEVTRQLIEVANRGYATKSNPRLNTKAAKSSFGKLASFKNADLAAELAFLPVLAVAGHALASGEVNPEAFQQVLGNSVSSAMSVRSYMLGSKPLNKGVGGVMQVASGTAFKARLAIANQEDGDTGKALAGLVAKEITMSAIGSFGTEYISNVLSNKMTPFGQAKMSLDMDRYNNMRGLLSTGIGAIASTVLGMIVGQQVKNFITDSPQPSLLEQTLQSAENYIRQVRQTDQENLVNDVAVYAEEGFTQYITYSTFSGDEEISSATREALYTESLTESLEVSAINSDELVDGFSFEV